MKILIPFFLLIVLSSYWILPDPTTFLRHRCRSLPESRRWRPAGPCSRPVLPEPDEIWTPQEPSPTGGSNRCQKPWFLDQECYCVSWWQIFCSIFISPSPLLVASPAHSPRHVCRSPGVCGYRACEAARGGASLAECPHLWWRRSAWSSGASQSSGLVCSWSGWSLNQWGAGQSGPDLFYASGGSWCQIRRVHHLKGGKERESVISSVVHQMKIEFIYIFVENKWIEYMSKMIHELDLCRGWIYKYIWLYL